MQICSSPWSALTQSCLHLTPGLAQAVLMEQQCSPRILPSLHLPPCTQWCYREQVMEMMEGTLPGRWLSITITITTLCITIC